MPTIDYCIISRFLLLIQQKSSIQTNITSAIYGLILRNLLQLNVIYYYYYFVVKTAASVCVPKY